MKEYTQEEIDDTTWWARLGRRMQKDLIDVMELPWSGYFDVSPADAKLAREFHASCQPNKQS